MTFSLQCGHLSTLGHAGTPQNRPTIQTDNWAYRSTRPLLVEVERQRGDGIGQDADAGVDGGHLHRKAFRHRLTRRRGRSEELGVRQRQVFCGADGAGDLRPNQDKRLIYYIYIYSKMWQQF